MFPGMDCPRSLIKLNDQTKMAKYRIYEHKVKEAGYRSLISPRMMDKMQEQIMNIIVMQKKYRDKDYSAQKLANEIGTSNYTISAVVNTRFHMSYSLFVNKHRIDEAMCLLVDKRYQDLNVTEIGDMVGFANPQSFYASFFRFKGITPRQYRVDNLQKHPAMVARRKAKV